MAIGKDVTNLIRFPATDSIGLLEWYPRRARDRKEKNGDDATDDLDDVLGPPPPPSEGGEVPQPPKK